MSSFEFPLKRHITLLPGDVILTGTPCHSRSVDPGDVVECEITGLGRLARTVANYRQAARKEST